LYATSEEVERLVAGFLDCSLPREAWTHNAHLAVAVWHLRRHGAEADLIEQVNHVIKECDRELPRRYYSEERLMSAEARKGWVTPDREPMS
jgi:hypothetical protein